MKNQKIKTKEGLPARAGELTGSNAAEAIRRCSELSTAAAPKWPPAAIEVRRRFGTVDNFRATYTPVQQCAVAEDEEAAYMGDAPTLGAVSLAYGRKEAVAWLCTHLIDLSEFSGARDKLDNYQLLSVAGIILAKWGYLKLTELMLFFVAFKGGEWGRFYGSVDCLAITSALREFARTRLERVWAYQAERERVEARRQRIEREREAEALRVAANALGMTPREYCLARQRGGDA